MEFFAKTNMYFRTNTYPKIPERYRLASADLTTSIPHNIHVHQQRSQSVHGQLPLTQVTNQTNQKRNSEGKEEEQVIYF